MTENQFKKYIQNFIAKCAAEYNEVIQVVLYNCLS